VLLMDGQAARTAGRMVGVTQLGRRVSHAIVVMALRNYVSLMVPFALVSRTSWTWLMYFDGNRYD